MVFRHNQIYETERLKFWKYLNICISRMLVIQYFHAVKRIGVSSEQY